MLCVVQSIPESVVSAVELCGLPCSIDLFSTGKRFCMYSECILDHVMARPYTESLFYCIDVLVFYSSGLSFCQW